MRHNDARADTKTPQKLYKSNNDPGVTRCGRRSRCDWGLGAPLRSVVVCLFETVRFRSIFLNRKPTAKLFDAEGVREYPAEIDTDPINLGAGKVPRHTVEIAPIRSG